MRALIAFAVCVSALATALAVSGQIACPALKTHLEVHTINVNNGAATVSRLMWRGEPLPNVASAIQGVRYVDAHCKVNNQDEYNVRMAVASTTTMAITAPAISALDSTFVADLPVATNTDKAVCWFTYELEVAGGNVLPCDSDSAFTFNGGVTSSSSRPMMMNTGSSSSSWNANANAPSPIMSSSSSSNVNNINEYALPTLAAGSYVCPAINFKQKVFPCANQASCAKITFEPVSSNLANTAVNLISVDLHYHVKGAPTNMHVQLKTPPAHLRAQLSDSASPLVMWTEPAIDTMSPASEIAYSFTYAVELPGVGRVDCDSDIYTTKINTQGASSNINTMAGVEVDAAGEYVWVFSGIGDDQRQQQQQQIVPQQQQQQQQYVSKQSVQISKENTIPQQQWTSSNVQAIKEQPMPMKNIPQQNVQYVQTQAQIPVQQSVSNQYISKQTPVQQIQAQPIMEQQQQIPVQQVSKQYISKQTPVQQIQAQPIMEQQQQQQQIPVQQMSKQFISKQTPVQQIQAQPIMEQQQQQNIPVQQVSKQYISKQTPQPVMEQQNVNVQTQQTYNTKQAIPVQQLQQQPQSVQWSVQQQPNVQSVGKQLPELQAQQQQQTTIPLTKQYITKQQVPVTQEQTTTVPQYITKTHYTQQQQSV